MTLSESDRYGDDRYEKEVQEQAESITLSSSGTCISIFLYLYTDVSVEII